MSDHARGAATAVLNTSGTLTGMHADGSRYAWSQLSQRWSPKHLQEQFLFCRDKQRIPDGWKTLSLGGWHLGHHPTLPVSTLTGTNNDRIGFLLGYPVTLDGVRVEGPTVAVTGSETAEGFERWLYSHGGRYTAAIITENLARVYLDPCGSLSAVYCPPLEIVAATPTLIPRIGDTGEIADLVASLGIPYNNCMCPVGLTTRRNVRRLLPNHTLDLRTWQSTRHWPRSTLAGQGETSQLLDQIATQTERQVGAFASKQPVLVALTAGRDSRMLIAAARKWAARIVLYTAAFEYPDKVSWRDLLIAGRIAEEHRIAAIRLPFKQPNPDHMEEWLYRTAGQVGEYRGWRGMTTLLQLPPKHPNLISPIPELMRGLYWTQSDREGKPIDPDRLLAKTDAGNIPVARQAIVDWLQGLPSPDPFLTMDLFYIEQRLGCWGGVYPYGLGYEGRFTIFPFCHRATITAMMSLPIESRFGDSVQTDFVGRYWPEMLEYPFNHVEGFDRVRLALHLAPAYARDTVALTARAVMHPVKAASVLKKRVKRVLSGEPAPDAGH